MEPSRDKKERRGKREAYLMFSTVSSGMGATVCTAGRFLLVAPFTKLEDEAEEDEAESVAPAGHDRHSKLKQTHWLRITHI